jgi:hypothetical protein
MATAGNDTTAYNSSFDGYVNGFFENEAGVGAVTSCENDWTSGWVVAGTLPSAECAATNVPVLGWAGLVALFGGLAGISRLVRRV